MCEDDDDDGDGCCIIKNLRKAKGSGGVIGLRVEG